MIAASWAAMPEPDSGEKNDCDQAGRLPTSFALWKAGFLARFAEPADVSAWFRNVGKTAKCFIFRL
jgi:hypothetical protein